MDKIYKMDIDTSKPIRQVVQMQQNSEGVLSVNVSNDGKYIRNLSCALYENGNEISAIAEGDNSFGYKFDVGETPHTVKITAKSTPIESIRAYVLSVTAGNRTKSVWLAQLVIPEGVYNQDEFASVLDLYNIDPKPDEGYPKIMFLHGDSTGKANFERIYITPWNPHMQYCFTSSDTYGLNVIPSDEPIVVSSEISVGVNQYVPKANTVTLSSITYPAVGYWTDYSLEHVIKPSTNAACYAEADIQEPTPEPDPEPDPEPTPEENA